MEANDQCKKRNENYQELVSIFLIKEQLRKDGGQRNGKLKEKLILFLDKYSHSFNPL